MNNSEGDFDQLLAADPSELMALLGASALPLAGSATELLNLGRSGKFYSPRPPVLGDDEPAALEHSGFQAVAQRFLSDWAVELKSAVCGKDAEFEAARKQGTTVLVTAVIGAITAKAPSLAPYSALLTVLAALIIQSGFRVICNG
ncbi:MAG: hypothetical protein ACK55F_13025 [Acidobacteriota bacterium]|jgi:hypothetical protein